MYDLINEENVVRCKCPFGEDTNGARRYCTDECQLYDTNKQRCSLAAIATELAKTQELLTKNIKGGRWEKITGMAPPEFHGHYTCSICGWCDKRLTTLRREMNYNFCPNCGAKMTEDSVNGD